MKQKRQAYQKIRQCAIKIEILLKKHGDACKNEKNLLKEHGDERDANDQHVQHIERGAQEGALVQDQPVRDEFQEQLQSEYSREEHVELT